MKLAFSTLGVPGLPLPDVECRVISLDDEVTVLPVGEIGEPTGMSQLGDAFAPVVIDKDGSTIAARTVGVRPTRSPTR